MFGKGLLTGLGITLKHMIRPKITEFYPEVKPNLSTRVRSSMGLQPDKCISCNMCVMACPNEVIKLTSEKDENNKKRLKSYHMDVGRCLFCGMCTEVCPTKAITVTQEYENAVYEVEDMQWDMIARAERKGKEG
ncbi:NuoI/complex I 23 kDa subunit family protein [Desulfosporosinus fructosivorans]